MQTNYTIEMQKVRDGWIWSIQQTFWDERGASRDGLHEDSDHAFLTAADAAADAERRIAEIEAGISLDRFNKLLARIRNAERAR
jgi:hypothetical protein